MIHYFTWFLGETWPGNVTDFMRFHQCDSLKLGGYLGKWEWPCRVSEMTPCLFQYGLILSLSSGLKQLRPAGSVKILLQQLHWILPLDFKTCIFSGCELSFLTNVTLALCVESSLLRGQIYKRLSLSLNLALTHHSFHLVG